MPLDTTNGRKLNLGQTFYLREYPGNVYRSVGNGRAEFVEHRSNPEYRGCQVPIGDEQEVDLRPGIKEPRQPRRSFALRHLCALCGATVRPSLELCEDCGGEPEDGSHLL